MVTELLREMLSGEGEAVMNYNTPSLFHSFHSDYIQVWNGVIAIHSFTDAAMVQSDHANIQQCIQLIMARLIVHTSI